MRREVIGRNTCRDGFLVSTVGFPGLGQYGGDWETAIQTATGNVLEVMERYPDRGEAFQGHARYIREHGGILLGRLRVSIE